MNSLCFALFLLAISTLTSISSGASCGGVVSLPRDEFQLIEYLPDGGYLDDQFCFWNLSPDPLKGDYARIHVTIFSFGIEPAGDGIILYAWNETGLVQSRHIRGQNFGNYVTIPTRYGALAFSTNSATTGNGFQAIIYASDKFDSPFSSKSYLLHEYNGSFTYPSDVGGQYYENNERVALIFQPANSTLEETWTISINHTDIEDDTLKVYQLARYNDEDQVIYVGSGSGYNPDGIPSLTTTSNFPRLILFSTNNEAVGTGFTLSWRKNPFHGASS